MNKNYAVIGCIPQFCIDLREFTEKIKITINTKGYDMDVKPEKNSIFLKNGKTVISIENRKFSKSRMTKRTTPLNSSREI